MSDDRIQTFLKADVHERLSMVGDNQVAPVLEQYLGTEAFTELRGLAGRLDTTHLGVRSPKNLIFVPGVMGSLLNSNTQGGVWWLDVRNLGLIDRLRLAPGGSRDADENVQIAPFTVDSSYMPFLKAVLERDKLGHVLFPYDWRKPLRASAAALKTLVDKLHSDNGNTPVHLVCHSMGGLMVRTALMEHPELWPKIDRIVFIATPHYGSPAIAGYLKNHLWGFEMLALLGRYLSRPTFRSLWGVLSLLPAPLGIYPGTRAGDEQPWTDPSVTYQHPCANFDLYDATAWRLPDLGAEETRHLQAALDGVADFHRRLWAHQQGLSLDHRSKMMVVAGVGMKGLFRLERRNDWTGLWKEMRKVTGRVLKDRHRDGDGRVPLASAKLDGVQVRYVRGVHGGLPNLPAVYRDVIRWLNDKPMQELSGSVDEALSAHLAIREGESEAPHLDGSARGVGRDKDDPGLWDPDPPQSRLDELQRKAEVGDLPELLHVKLL